MRWWVIIDRVTGEQRGESSTLPEALPEHLDMVELDVLERPSSAEVQWNPQARRFDPLAKTSVPVSTKPLADLRDKPLWTETDQTRVLKEIAKVLGVM